MIKNKILIVDDDKMFANRLGNMIESLGYEVKAVFSPEDALLEIRNNDYNVCLIDLFFNGKEEGIELVRKMKAISDASAFIMLTAFGSIQNAIAAVKAGADDYIAKGASGMVNIDQLDMAINSSLKQQKLRKELLLSNKIFESLHSLSLMSSIEIDDDNCNSFGQKICKLVYDILEVDFVITARVDNNHSLQLCHFYKDILEINDLESLLNLLQKEVVEKKQPFIFNSDVNLSIANNDAITSLISVPINSSEEGLLGVIAVGSFSSSPIYSFAPKLLQIFAQRIAAEITRSLFIQERKRIYEQLANAQKIEAVSNLAGGVAHDFNNILCIILANAQLINEKFNDNFIHNTIKAIEDACDRGEHLVKQLINTVKVEVGELEPVDMNKVLQFVYNLLSNSIANGYVIELNNDDSDKFIIGNPGQIENALINLCINSIDALEARDKLILSAENISISDKKNPDNIQPGDYILISVRDTGKGIDEKTLPHIFDPFFTTKNRTGGKGLGLTLVHNTVKKHKGHIFVSSKPGEGTVFNIYLPKLDDNDMSQNIQTTHKNIENVSEKILVVDDEDSLRETLKSILELNNYTVIDATDGIQACEIYQSDYNNIELVILDMIMPKMGGFETYKKLKEVNPNVKILIISAFSENHEVTEMLESNAVAFLHKPFKIKEILSVIKSAKNPEKS